MRTTAADARRAILDDELEQLRELPYSHWQALVGVPKTKSLAGRDGRTYRVLVTPAWDSPRSTDVRVHISVRRVRWTAARHLAGSFVSPADDARVVSLGRRSVREDGENGLGYETGPAVQPGELDQE